MSNPFIFGRKHLRPLEEDEVKTYVDTVNILLVVDILGIELVLTHHIELGTAQSATVADLKIDLGSLGHQQTHTHTRAGYGTNGLIALTEVELGTQVRIVEPTCTVLACNGSVEHFKRSDSRPHTHLIDKQET